MTMHQWRGREWGKRGGVGIGVAIASSFLSATVSHAQKQALPPPPSIPGSAAQLELAPLPRTAPGPVMPELPTTGYPQAPLPQGALPPTVLPPGAGQSLDRQLPDNYGAAYQVLVYGDSPYLLRQIRFLEPSASIQDYQGRRVIVAGMFDNEGAARQRVLALGRYGIGAQMLALSQPVAEQRVASLSPAPVPPLATGWNAPPAPLAPVPAPMPSLAATPSLPAGVVPPLAANPGMAGQVQIPHFQVVVPTPPADFAAIANKMISMGVRPEAIQAKQKPLGPHLAVGPFLQQDEAEAVSRYLKVGGMDARVYYAK